MDARFRRQPMSGSKMSLSKAAFYAPRSQKKGTTVSTTATKPEVPRAPITPDTKTFPIIEIFGPTVQGEGRMTGTPVYFVRTGGCDYRCSWCDTPHAVLPEEVRKNATKMTSQQILDALQVLEGDPGWVVISGGNPAMHDLQNLVDKLHRAKFKVSVETQGTMFKPWLLDVDLLTLSPKPPSSGMNPQKDFTNLTRLITLAGAEKKAVDLKIVAFDDEDMKYAKEIFRRYPATDHLRHFISLGTLVGTSTRDDLLDRCRSLVEYAVRDKTLARVSVGVQFHVLLWGHVQGV